MHNCWGMKTSIESWLQVISRKITKWTKVYITDGECRPDKKRNPIQLRVWSIACKQRKYLQNIHRSIRILPTKVSDQFVALPFSLWNGESPDLGKMSIRKGSSTSNIFVNRNFLDETIGYHFNSKTPIC